MKELKVLFPTPEFVSVAGRKVMIKPVKFKHFESFSNASTVVLALASSQTVEQLYAYSQKTKHLETVLITSTNLTRWRIRRLPAVAAVHLMLHVIRVNAFFFERALVEMGRVLGGEKSLQN
ncbi:MAG: hypothetical protein RBR22_13195 [Desulfuromonas sp.]|nr:hypothetical protein [Desulfuromonas sp.]